jgi:hypothetical protein
LTAASAVIAKQLGVGKESVRRWVIQDQVDGGQRQGVTTEELVEIKALKAKVRRLEEDNLNAEHTVKVRRVESIGHRGQHHQHHRLVLTRGARGVQGTGREQHVDVGGQRPSSLTVIGEHQ